VGSRKLGRNDPCVCGSGRKYKRCCLEDPRKLEAMAVAVQLPYLFPLLRPEDEPFEAWLAKLDAAGRLPGWPPAALVNEGIDAISDQEQDRILAAVATDLADVWGRLREALEDEDVLRSLVLGGAVAAALGEERALHPRVLALLEEREELRADSIGLLLCVLDGTQVWSALDGEELERAVDGLDDELGDEEYEEEFDAIVDGIVERSWTDRHARRLAFLVARVRRQVPRQDFPATSASLTTACARFEEDETLTPPLAAMLLADTLGPPRPEAHSLAA